MTSQHKLLPSLLDRLLDDRPHQSIEASSQRLCSLADYKASIVRDLEILVNTRQSLVANELEGFVNLGGTILDYGMPDFTSRSVLDPKDRLLIQRQLEKATRCCRSTPRNTKCRTSTDARRSAALLRKGTVAPALFGPGVREPVSENRFAVAHRGR
jgi:type VI secretion system lysozyme-like protein